MKYSKDGLALTESFEGLRLNAYLDSVGVPTLAWGHTRGVKLGDICTREQADAWLLEDIAFCEQDVNMHVKVPLTQAAFDSLCDFCFNLGSGSLNGSTLLRLLNAGDYQGAAKEFSKWDHAGGKVLAGLLKRRQEEEALFLKDLPQEG